jgi:hypothetical protein
MRAVFDEAGDTGQKPGSTRYLVVAGIACENLEPLRRVAAWTRKTLHKDLRQIPEIKARHTPAKVISKMLNRVAAMDIEIYATSLDKGAAKPPLDSEDWYRTAYSETIRQVLKHHAQVIVTMDQRYTQTPLRDKLVNAIVATAQRPGTTLSFIMTDSQGERALQVADVIAWSVFQKYERENEEFYRLIEHKISGEVMLLR